MMQMLLRKYTRTIISTRDTLIVLSRIYNSYNLLIVLAADGGWPPVANFTLVFAGGILRMSRIIL